MNRQSIFSDIQPETEPGKQPGQRRRAMFKFDGSTYTLEEMRTANEHDEELLAWIETSEVGDIFCGCKRIE